MNCCKKRKLEESENFVKPAVLNIQIEEDKNGILTIFNNLRLDVMFSVKGGITSM